MKSKCGAFVFQDKCAAVGGAQGAALPGPVHLQGGRGWSHRCGTGCSGTAMDNGQRKKTCAGTYVVIFIPESSQADKSIRW